MVALADTQKKHGELLDNLSGEVDGISREFGAFSDNLYHVSWDVERIDEKLCNPANSAVANGETVNTISMSLSATAGEVNRINQMVEIIRRNLSSTDGKVYTTGDMVLRMNQSLFAPDGLTDMIDKIFNQLIEGVKAVEKTVEANSGTLQAKIDALDEKMDRILSLVEVHSKRPEKCRWWEIRRFFW
ncbi:hypothetical protein MMC12_000135 [Toensbergia leucococca]|nr:hypothetical protein [Toensbergia leucococca]